MPRKPSLTASLRDTTLRWAAGQTKGLWQVTVREKSVSVGLQWDRDPVPSCSAVISSNGTSAPEQRKLQKNVFCRTETPSGCGATVNRMSEIPF